jgi:hypothetical protein
MANEHRDPLEARVITVSREALRADLAEMRKDINAAMSDMELRMTRTLAEMLARKADLAMHQELEGRVRATEREGITRGGPAWNELRSWVQDVENMATSHDRLVPEFRELQNKVATNTGRIKSEAELRAMYRDERGKETGAQWSTVSKVIVIITTLVAIAGLWLAWSRADAAASEGEEERSSARTYLVAPAPHLERS